MITEPTFRDLGWTAARLARHLEVALAAMDLSTAQYRMLVQLAEGAEASTSLAKKLAVSAPSVTAVVDGLVQRNAIARTHSEEDRRRVSLALTPQGRELLERADVAVGERLVSIAAELEDPLLEQQALSSLGLWSEALDRHRAHRLAQRGEPAAAGRG